MELNTQDMLLSGDSQQLRRREQNCVSLRENCLSSLAGERTQNENPKLGRSGLKMHPTCGVNTPCKECVKYHAVEKGRRRKKEGEIKKKEEGRKKMGRQPW